MKKYICLLSLIFLGKNLNAQTFIQAYQNRANQVLQSNVNTILQEFESFGIKRTGTTANDNARNWIKNKYISYGYSANNITEQTFSFGSTTSKNLIITKTGTVYPNKFVIVCGHFDSIVGPGVSDNGSGTAAILETARILQNIPTEYSIKFIHFSGEEQGLYGSEAYVNDIVNATNPKMDIKVVFNLDQVGGKIGNNNTTIYCDVDQSAPTSNNAASQDIATQLANCTTLYTTLQTAYDPAYSSDYVPFMDNGDVVTGFYEFTRSYNEHTVNDTYAQVDTNYVYNVAKAAVAATQHFAVALTTLGTNEVKNNKIDIEIYPSPVSNFLTIEIPNHSKEYFNFEVTDMSGKLVLNAANKTTIDITSLQDGIYIGTIHFKDGKYFKKKFVVKK